MMTGQVTVAEVSAAVPWVSALDVAMAFLPCEKAFTVCQLMHVQFMQSTQRTARFRTALSTITLRRPQPNCCLPIVWAWEGEWRGSAQEVQRYQAHA